MAKAMTDNSIAATSTVAGEEALSPFKIAQAYSSATTVAAGVVAAAQASYAGANTAILEGSGGRIFQFRS